MSPNLHIALLLEDGLCGRQRPVPAQRHLRRGREPPQLERGRRREVPGPQGGHEGGLREVHLSGHVTHGVLAEEAPGAEAHARGVAGLNGWCFSFGISIIEK